MSVVLPVYDEAPNLPRILPQIDRVLGKSGRAHEILVVDDASPDGSAEVARRIAAAHGLPVEVIERRGERSLAGAVIEGARQARYPCVAVLDADLSHDPTCLPLLIQKVLERRADVVVGSRYVDGGRISSWTANRRAMSLLGTWLAREVTGLRDPLSGFFAARCELLDGSVVPLRPRGYKILLEVLGRTPDLRVEEVPIVFRDRRLGESKFRFREKKEFLVQVGALLAGRLSRSLRGRGVERVVGTRARAGVARSPSSREQSENAERCGGVEA